MAQAREMVVVPPLTEREFKAIQTYLSILRERFGKRMEKIVLFGSKSRGDSEPDSDIDILVIMSDEDREQRRMLIGLASQISLDYDVLLSPRVMSRKKWESKQGFTMYRNVQHDGLLLSLKEGKLAFEPITIAQV